MTLFAFIVQLSWKNVGELYENTKKREKVIEEVGYQLEIIWLGQP